MKCLGTVFGCGFSILVEVVRKTKTEMERGKEEGRDGEREFIDSKKYGVAAPCIAVFTGENRASRFSRGRLEFRTSSQDPDHNETCENNLNLHAKM